MIVFLCENFAEESEEITSRPPRGSQSAICSVMLVSVWGDQSAVEPMTSSGRAVLDEAMARSDGIFSRCLQVLRLPSGGHKWTLDLHNLSPGAAVAMALWMLSQLTKLEVRAGGRADGGGDADSALEAARMPERVVIVTGWGKHHSAWKFMGEQRGVVRGAVFEALRVCGVPTRPWPVAADAADEGTTENPGMVELDIAAFGGWLKRAIASGLVRGYFARDERLIIGLSPKDVRTIVSASHGRAGGGAERD